MHKALSSDLAMMTLGIKQSQAYLDDSLLVYVANLHTALLRLGEQVKVLLAGRRMQGKGLAIDSQYLYIKSARSEL